MLTELSDLQESDEDVWGMSKVSFTVETRSTEDNELIEREYTFSKSKHWEGWMFHEFEERRSPDTTHITSRNWRRTKNVIYEDGEATNITVPPEVERELEELMGVDEVIIQSPGGTK